MWVSQSGVLLIGLVGGLGLTKSFDLSGRGGRRWLTLILAVSGLGASTAVVPNTLWWVGGFVSKPGDCGDELT